MNKWRTTGTALALSLAVFSGGAQAVLAADAQSAIDHYVAFGDSLTVGWEPAIGLTGTPYGFVDRVYEQALYRGSTNLKNYGIAGLTSTGLKNLLTAVAEGKQVTGADIQPNLPDPRADRMVADTQQIKQDLLAADLITITIGGNDFIDLPVKMIGLSESEVTQLVTQRLATYAENTGTVLHLIHELNPNAQVVLADQYNPVPPLDASLYANLQKMTGAMSETIDAMIAAGVNDLQMKLKAAHVAPVFVGKEISHTHILEQDIHPNQAGYEEMAKVFANTIWGDYKQPNKNDAFTVGVIVKGTEVNSPFPYTPRLEMGVTYVPVRAYAEALGAQVQWSDQTGTATLTYQDRTVAFTNHSQQVVSNGMTMQAPGPTHLFADKLYVPVRTLAESLGYDLRFVAASNMAYIN